MITVILVCTHKATLHSILRWKTYKGFIRFRFWTAAYVTIFMCISGGRLEELRRGDDHQ